MHIYLNTFIKNIVRYLQQKYVGRHKRNSAYSTTSDAHYKDKIFPYGVYLHATIKVADQTITCTSTKPNNIIQMKFSLDFCDECPK